MVPLRSLLVLCSIAGLAAAQGGQGDILELPRTGELMDKWGKASDCPGQLVVVVSAGRTWTRAVGYADIGKKLPFQDWTRIPLGRLTRDLLHVGVDLAAKKGLLDLRNAVGRSLVDNAAVPDDVRKSSWRDLLRQRLPAYYFFSPARGVMRPLDVVVREHVFASPVRRPSHLDSHAEAAVLQYALEGVVKMPWARYLKEVVGPALGLRGTVDASTLGWTGGLKVYGTADKAGKRTAAEPLFAEVPAAYNAWTSADDIQRYLKSILKVPKADAGERFHQWTVKRAPLRSMRYITLTEASRSISCVVHAFRDHDLAMFWFSNAPNSGRSTAVREAVLKDLYGDPVERDIWNAAIGLGPGGAGGLWRKMRRSWRGTLRVGHARPKDVPIEIAVHGNQETLRTKAGCVTGYRLSVNAIKASGTIVLSDPGGRVELEMLMVGDDLVGVATWSNSANVRLPRRLTLTPSPSTSEPYPPAPKGTVK
jgi:CubicO group peptidase (beta-lactamase class C family)